MATADKPIRATRVEIELEALEHNFKQVRHKVGAGVKIMAVVKANAYGHGIVETTQTLLDAGADYFGVANVEEGMLLRERGVEAPILVFTPPFPEEVGSFLDYNFTATVCSGDIADQLDAVSSARSRVTSVHVKVDTGMGRLGVDYRQSIEFVRYLSSLRHLKLEGIYTHFANAEQADKSYAKLQLSRFHDVVSTLSNGGIDIPLKHCANSAAILDLKDSYYNMVRPGIMLYGYYPSNKVSRDLPLEPSLSLRSKINFLKRVDAGTSISYGRKYITSGATTIATVPVGYGDGINRHLTNNGEAIVKGKRCPIVGTVCMDHLMLDVGSARANFGDGVTFIGTDGDETITAWDIAEKLGTIPYEVCCAISARVPRIYL